MRLNNILLISSLCCLAPFTAWAGGGLVHDGAGVVEQDFIYAYESIPQSVASCFQNPRCAGELPADAIQALKDISSLVSRNILTTHPLHFVSAKASPGFFDLSVTEPNRIAMTELRPNAQIFINTDLLYTADGIPAVDFGKATAILIHEVGHQTGRQDHAFLDFIGSKVRENLASNISFHTAQLVAGKNDLTIQIVDFNLVAISSSVYYSSGDKKLPLNGVILQSITCPGSLNTPVGFELSNGHWEHATYLTTSEIQTRFKAWSRFSCLDSHGVLTSHSADIEVKFILSPPDGGSAPLDVLSVKAKSSNYFM
jgi:hypothetical protein